MKEEKIAKWYSITFYSLMIMIIISAFLFIELAYVLLFIAFTESMIYIALESRKNDTKNDLCGL